MKKKLNRKKAKYTPPILLKQASQKNMNPPVRSHDNAFVNKLCTSVSLMYMKRPLENIRSQLQIHNAQMNGIIYAKYFSSRYV